MGRLGRESVRIMRQVQRKATVALLRIAVQHLNNGDPDKCRESLLETIATIEEGIYDD